MANKLSALSVTQLESLISRYPWFSLARKELYMRTSLMGEEYRKLGMKRSGIYISSREKLIKDGLSQTAVVPSGSAAHMEIDSRDKQTIRVIGGDWFSQEDLNSVGERFIAFSDASDTPQEEQPYIIPQMPDEMFYTETLARIYGEQELHQMAIDVYEKLILIYPEKSTYFAALIEEQKKHLKD